MKKSTIITIIAFALGIIVLCAGFILLTDNNISKKLFSTTTTTTTTTTGAPRPEYKPMDLFNTDISQYVTLGQYKDLSVEVDMLEASDEDIDFEITIALCQSGEFTKARSGKISEMIPFSFNFTGYLTKDDGTKGEAFKNGAGTDQLAYIDGDRLMTISSDGIGSFIDGFAQGILGKSVGDTFDLEITFPDDYHAEELKGKKTIFEIKINYIAETNFTDGWVKEYTKDQYKTCDEYRNSIKETINANLKKAHVAAIWEQVIENATILSIPQEQLDYWYWNFRGQVEQYVYMYQMYGYQVTYEQMLVELGFENDDALKDYAEDMVEEELVMYAIIKAEQLEASDEEYRIFIESYMESSGKTEAEILEMYTEEYIRQQIVLNKIDNVVYDLNDLVLKSDK